MADIIIRLYGDHLLSDYMNQQRNKYTFKSTDP